MSLFGPCNVSWWAFCNLQLGKDNEIFNIDLRISNIYSCPLLLHLLLFFLLLLVVPIYSCLLACISCRTTALCITWFVNSHLAAVNQAQFLQTITTRPRVLASIWAWTLSKRNPYNEYPEIGTRLKGNLTKKMSKKHRD